MTIRLNTQPTTWRDRLEVIKTAKKEYSDYYSIMTPYERSVADREIGNLQTQHNKAITEGVLAEHDSAISTLKRAHDRVKAEHKKEIARWDAQRLSSELTAYNMLIDQAIKTRAGTGDFRESTASRLEKIYSEAWESGDQYKQRAICEVMAAAESKADGMDANIKMAVNRLAQQSKADIEKARTTPELDAAYQTAETAWQNYRNARQEAIRTSIEIGEGDPQQIYMTGPFARALKRVQIDKDTQEIQIFDPADPAATGVFV